MFWASLWEMTKGRWREFRREPSAFFFVLLMPIVAMVTIGLAFSRPQQTHHTIGVEATEQDLSHSHPEFSWCIDQRDALERQLVRGVVQLIVTRGADGTLHYRFDPTNPKAQEARHAIDEALQKSAGRSNPLLTVDEPVTVVGSRYLDFLIPGLLALSLFTTSLFGTGMTIVAHRREHLLKRYLATPMSPAGYFLSHMLGRALIFFVECAVALGTGSLLFGFQIQSGLVPFLSFAALGTAAFTALALLLGSRARNTATYSGLNNLMTLPLMLLCGVWFSRQAFFPSWLADSASWLPLAPLVDGLRSLANEGVEFSALKKEIAVLLAYLIIALIGTKKLFRWD